MTLCRRLIARLLFALLLIGVAPLGMAGERMPAAGPQDCAIVIAVAETPALDVGGGIDDQHAPSLDEAGSAEPLEPDVDAQECALPTRGASIDAAAVTAPIAFLYLPVPSPALAALDRPPRGF